MPTADVQGNSPGPSRAGPLSSGRTAERSRRPVRILYSFPHKIGAARICSTAWYEAAEVANAGGEVTLFSGVLDRPLPRSIRVRTTLACGRWRIPYRAIGQLRALALHDRIVARQLPRLVGSIDVIHAWPLAALETLRVAKQFGIPTVIERPNAHTRFAMEAVAAECDRLGVTLPRDHEHAYNEIKLRKEEEEYRVADRVLCPSDFVVETFAERGFAREKLVRHSYGYDPTIFHVCPDTHDRREPGLNAVFVGVCAVRKGVHFAVEAWLRSSASRKGKFRIAGEFLPAYERKLAAMLAHPSVEVLGHRNDVPELMRNSDILLLPSIEEGLALSCMEAIGSGCVPLVSRACTDACVHGENALVHAVGDVDALTEQISSLDTDRHRLRELREGCLRSAPQLTWSSAGRGLLEVYEKVVSDLSLPTPRRLVLNQA